MLKAFLLAVQFLTWVPVPPRGEPEPTALRWSTGFYPLVGGLVGLVCAGVFLATWWLLSPLLAAIAAIVAGQLLTGGLHEDGLADYADSLGAYGGPERRLEIMRDSHNGTFGVLAIVVGFAVPIVVLSAVPLAWAWRGLILSHLLSRFAALLAGRFFPSASHQGLGRSFSMRTGAPQILLGFATCAVGLWQTQAWTVPIALILPWPLALLLALHARLRLGGLTGDVLGAIIMVFQLGFYLGLAAHFGGTS